MKKGFLLSEKISHPGPSQPPSLGPLLDGRIHRTTWGDVTCADVLRVASSRSSGWTSAPPIRGAPHLPRRPSVTSSAVDQPAFSGEEDGSSDDHNRYADVLTIPFKTAKVPMAALSAYYGRLNVQVRATHYHSWNDGNPKSHLLRWTCVFVCPMTGEVFTAGAWPDHSATVDSSTVRWLATKAAAKHGAAAWAYDCFHFRQGPARVVSLGSEEPYLESTFELNASVPADIRTRVHRQQLDVPRAAAAETAAQAMEEGEQAWDRRPDDLAVSDESRKADRTTEKQKAT